MTTIVHGKKGAPRSQVPHAKRVRTRKRPRQRRSHVLDARPSLPEQVQAQREQLFKALSIVQCCKHASATLFEVEDLEYMVPTFDALHDLLNNASEELERIAVACTNLPGSARGSTRRTTAQRED